MYTLTKDDIKYIKSCDRIVFRHVSDMTSRLELIKEPPADDKFAFEKRFNVEGIPDNLNCKYKAFCMGTGYKSPLRLLRAGDGIRLQWYRDGALNEYIKDSICNNDSALGTDGKLHADMLFLHVNRGRTQVEIAIRTQICPDNSARMIKEI